MKKPRILYISVMALLFACAFHGKGYADIGASPVSVMSSEGERKGEKDPGQERRSVISVTEKGKHGPIEFLVTITDEGKIADIAVGDNIEARISKINKRRFLKQFEGKNSGDPLMIGRDIDAVTGATISSSAAARAARRALADWEQR